MRIRVNGSEAARLFEFDLMEELDPASMEPQADRESGQPRLVDGKPVYRVQFYVSDRETGRQLRDVSVKLLNKPQAKVSKGFDVHLAGTVQITPYITNANRLGYSIVADGLEGAK